MIKVTESKSKKNKCKCVSYVALAIPIICIFTFVNCFAKIIPFIKLSGLVLYLPLFTSPFGVIISCISLRINKDILSKISLLLNVILLLLQILFLIFGSVFIII